MMSFTISTFQPEDTAAVVALWNQLYIYDQTDETRFAQVINDLYCCEQTYALVARENGNIQGVAAVAIDGDTTYLRAIAAIDSDSTVVKSLLDSVSDYLRSNGVQAIECCRFQGAYFFPAIDVRYAEMIYALKAYGFAEAETIYDARIELATWKLNDYQAGVRERVAADGVSLVHYSAADETAMREFIAQSGVAHWFPPGWETELQHVPTVIARKEDVILGYVQYRPSGDLCAFGPAAVLPDHRQSGIGTALLTYVMQKQQAAGIQVMTASWVWPLKYYELNGWGIGRTYNALRKQL